MAPHLTTENCEDVLAAARHKTKRHVELMVATLRPKPAVPAVVRKLPEPKRAEQSCSIADGQALLAPASDPCPTAEVVAAPVAVKPGKASVIAPLAPQRYKLQVTLSAGAYQTLRHAQELLRHSVPDGDLAVIVERALKLLVRELEQTKFAATERPGTSRPSERRSRHIPAAVRRRVWERDGGRCAFVGTEGRCTERGFLEFHHVVPYADGGENLVKNVELRCRAHNAYEAARWEGTLFVREAHACFFKLGLDRLSERPNAVRARIDTWCSKRGRR